MLHSSSVKRVVGHEICHRGQYFGVCDLVVLSMLPLDAEYAKIKVPGSLGVAKPKAELTGRYELSSHNRDIETTKESASKRAWRYKAGKAETESLVNAFMEYQQGSLVNTPCSGKQQTPPL